eukprot:12577608-Heterocapsa_arctica.AAC.1
MRRAEACERVGYSQSGSGAAPRHGMSWEDATRLMRSQLRSCSLHAWLPPNARRARRNCASDAQSDLPTPGTQCARSWSCPAQ